MTLAKITTQIEEFNEGFAAQIGTELSDVFAQEQRELNAAGLPADLIAVGTALPHASLQTTAGEKVDLAAALNGKPAVLVFYRGAWCPYCNITLKTYQAELLPTLTERGFSLVAVSPQTPQSSELTATSAELGFDVLSDPGNALARALGIVTAPSEAARAAHTQLGFDVADSNADATADIPFPTVVIVNAAGIVSFIDVQVDYTQRTEVAEILDALDAAASAA